MKHLFSFITLFSLLITFQGFSQDQQSLDSIRNNPIYQLKQVDKSCQNPEVIADAANKVLALTTNSENTALTAKAYQLLGKSNWMQNNYILAIDLLKKSVNIYQQLNDSTELAHSLNLIGVCYQQKGQYDQALDYLQQALLIREKLKDKSKYASTLNNLGIVYRVTGHLEQSLIYYKKGYSIFKEIGDKNGYSTTESNIGLIYNQLENYEDALSWLLKSLETKKELKDTLGLASTYENLGQVNFNIANYTKALECLSSAINLFKVINNQHGLAVSNSSIAAIYLKRGNHDKAFEHITASQNIAEPSEDYAIIKDNYKLLSDYYFAKGDLPKSREMMNKYAETVEKMFGKQVSEKYAELTAGYETEQKEYQNKLLQANLQIEKYKLQRSKDSQLFYILIIIAFILLMIYTMLLLYRLRKKNYEIEKINSDLNVLNLDLEEKINARTKDLTEALKKAEESDELKSAFLANMSHEIRTPVNGMLGFARALEDESITTEDRKHYVEIVNRQGHILLQIINDIVNISKIDVGQFEIKKTACFSNTMLNDLYSMFSSNSFHNKNSNIELRMVKSLSDERCIIFTDPLRLEQIMINLLDNAFKFTNEGYIEFGYALDLPNKIKFYVKDSGIGIPEDQFKKIFNRFYKHKHQQQPLYGGAGIGLSISKGIAELIDGEIKVESKVGEGSCFSIVIPYIPISAAYGSNEYGEKIKKSNYSWPNKTILVVEDDLISYQYIEVLLKKTGVKMVHVKNGEDAIEVCQISKNTDLVLMDMQLPFISGYEATQKIKTFQPNLPIIAQTANVMNNEKVRCIDAGCNDYISKPIDPDEFMSVLAKYLS